jgi:DNA helicase IV
VAAVKRRPGTHNARRRTLESILWRHLFEQLSDPSPLAAGTRESDDITPEELGRSLRRTPAVAEALDRMWPLLSPESFLHDLFGAPPLIELAARDVLSSVEREMLHRERVGPGEEVWWTESDVPLLDEAYALLGQRRRQQGHDGVEAIRTFGHVVVDEAQDLAPMQLRMVARRSLSGSMTVVGDIAQATGSWVPSSWAQVVEHLPARRGWRMVDLTVNYRTPSEIMAVAARVLERVAPGMRPAESVRSSGSAPRVLSADLGPSFPAESLADLAARSVVEELDAISGGLAGTVGVITPPSLFDAVAAATEAMGSSFGQAGRGALDQPATLLLIGDAKGLEFDSVIVVEPSRIASEAPQGLRALYVAFTRATQRLVIVHSEALPVPLATAVQHSA